MHTAHFLDTPSGKKAELKNVKHLISDREEQVQKWSLGFNKVSGLQTGFKNLKNILRIQRGRVFFFFNKERNCSLTSLPKKYYHLVS